MKKTKATLLVVDDEAYVRESLTLLLQRDGYRVRSAAGAEEALRGSLLEGVDLTLADLRLGEEDDGLSLLRSLRERAPAVPVVMLTAHGSVSKAVECMQAGAADFLQKPADPDKLLLVIERVLQETRLRRELDYLRSEPDWGGRNPVGVSEPWKQVLELVRAAAPTDASVLILGESGTGKEEVARLIHRRSARADRPFVRVNCAAIPVELFESEYFGHRKGAFTGAASDRDGRFRVADQGTLLLDEIALMPAPAQAKVLRVLEDGLFERVGDTHPTQVDVRVVAATNADLEREIEQGRFRQDLYYRLNVISIDIPPLRERKSDIGVLATAFIEEFSGKLGRAVEGMEPETLAILRAYRWPGNVRELRNVIERAVILEQTSKIRPSSLPLQIRETPAPRVPLHLRQALLAEERRLLQEALRSAGGVRREAARRLGIDERNLSYYLKKHDLQ